jgi:hypothetical protein
MLSPAAFTSWSAPAGSRTLARAAFAALGRAEQRLLEAIVFEGRRCSEIATAIGGTAAEVRGRAASALDALRGELLGSTGERRELGTGDLGGAVAAMLALRALDALDPDEAALIDAMLAHQPAMQRAYADHEAVVAALCATVPRIAPAAEVLARLGRSIGDDRASN